jgi:hypothetical protein
MGNYMPVLVTRPVRTYECLLCGGAPDVEQTFDPPDDWNVPKLSYSLCEDCRCLSAPTLTGLVEAVLQSSLIQ